MILRDTLIITIIIFVPIYIVLILHFFKTNSQKINNTKVKEEKPIQKLPEAIIIGSPKCGF
jgi:ascorbate-specific PTS system EIIC-type component UlaA